MNNKTCVYDSCSNEVEKENDLTCPDHKFHYKKKKKIDIEERVKQWKKRNANTAK